MALQIYLHDDIVNVQATSEVCRILLNIGVEYLIIRIDIKAAEVCFSRPIYYLIDIWDSLNEY